MIVPERVVLTTTTSVAGRAVEREVDIVAAEVALTRDMFGDAAMGVHDHHLRARGSDPDTETGSASRVFGSR